MDIAYKLTLHIAYKLTLQDVVEANRVGWPRAGWKCKLYLYGCLAILFLGLISIAGPYSSLSQFPFIFVRWKPMLEYIYSCLGGTITAILIICLFMRSQSMNIMPKHLVLKVKFGRTSYRWCQISDIIDTGSHICFCLHTTTAALIVPKSAFLNAEQSQAFIEQAKSYWRSETGQKDPMPLDQSHVWPPAPFTTDSVELSEKAKR